MIRSNERRACAITDRARVLGREILGAHAGDVDRENRFPHESFEALRASGLMGLFVPESSGGIGGDVPVYCRVAHALGRGCLSSALNYVMHVQQAAVMAEYAPESLAEDVRAIARGEVLIASVTSERGKGGDLSRAKAPILREGDSIRLKREAPIVSYCAHADAFLVLMRESEDAPETETRLVWVRADDGAHTVSGVWGAMGMRGTQSLPCDFDAVLPSDRVLPVSFKEIGDRTLLPLGVIGFASVWTGAARGVLDGVTARLRERGETAPAALATLARLRGSLDVAERFILELAERIELARATDWPQDSSYWIDINTAKVVASDTAFEVADGLIKLVGLRDGFMNTDRLPLERVFRDLRSASLMHHNERLLAVSGKMMIMERLVLEEGTPSGPMG